MRLLCTNPCRDAIVPAFVDAIDSIKGEDDHCWIKATLLSFNSIGAALEAIILAL